MDQVNQEILDAIPFNKIIAFGGDYRFIDGVAGSSILAWDNVSRALSAKVAAGVFDVGQAVRIAQALFYDNPLRIFKLGGKIQAGPGNGESDVRESDRRK